MTTEKRKPGRKPRPLEEIHGTRNAYTNRKCRCDECRAAAAAYIRKYHGSDGTGVRHAPSADPRLHGTERTYGEGCRCDDCVRAHDTGSLLGGTGRESPGSRPTNEAVG